MSGSSSARRAEPSSRATSAGTTSDPGRPCAACAGPTRRATWWSATRTPWMRRTAWCGARRGRRGGRGSGGGGGAGGRGPGDRDSARLVFRSTFVPAADATPGEVPREPTRFVDGAGTTIGAALPPGTPWLALSETAAWPARAIAGKRLEGVWQLIGDLPAVLREDLPHLAAPRGPGPGPAPGT